MIKEMVFLLVGISFTFAAEYGTLKDSRDGRIYKTVKIGNQIWMAENLDYQDPSRIGDMKVFSTSLGQEMAYVHNPKCKGKAWNCNLDEAAVSVCLDNNPQNCKKYGRLYTFGSLHDVCPQSYGIPSKDDWETLVKFIQKDSKVSSKDVGFLLKSKEGWDKVGVNPYGFSAISAPYLTEGQDGGDLHRAGVAARFWTRSTEKVESPYDEDDRWYESPIFFELIRDDHQTRFGHWYLEEAGFSPAYSVRCIKEE